MLAPPPPARHTLPTALDELKKQRLPLRDFSEQAMGDLPKLDRLALWITGHVGTIGFFLIILSWTTAWLGWNLLAPRRLQFDPPMAFVFWLFISNVIQILLMPLIMVGQNIQGKRADLRSQHDLEINIRAEAEIENVLYHLEYQNAILIAMLGKLGIDLDQAVLNTTP